MDISLNIKKLYTKITFILIIILFSIFTKIINVFQHCCKVYNILTILRNLPVVSNILNKQKFK